MSGKKIVIRWPRVAAIAGVFAAVAGAAVWTFSPSSAPPEASPVPWVSPAAPTRSPSPTATRSPTAAPPSATPSATATPPAHRRHACSHSGKEIVVHNYHDCMEKCDPWQKCNAAFPLKKFKEGGR
jgi:hypothetical protein